MSNLNIQCLICGSDNPIDIFKAEEGSRILCKNCNEFIQLTFKDGMTAKKIEENIIKEIKNAFPKKIKLNF